MGRNLALSEIKLIVAKILRKFRLQLPDNCEEIAPTLRVNLVQKDGFNLRLRKRSNCDFKSVFVDIE